MVWGKKKEEKPAKTAKAVPAKTVNFTEDKNRAKAIRAKAKTKLQEAGIDTSDTKKGVGRKVAKTAKGQRAQQDREAINKHVRRAGWTSPEYGVGKSGSKSEWD